MDPLALSSKTAALLVVDVQERLLAAMPPREATRLVASIELLTETARLFQMPVVVTEQHPKGLGPTAASLRAIFEQFSSPIRVVEKTVFDAFEADGVADAIASTGAASVIVVGMEAHVCVFQTARSAAAKGYRAHVPYDAVCSREPASKRTALRSLGGNGVTITSAETVAFDLLGDAKNPHFKAISARVKALPLDTGA